MKVPLYQAKAEFFRTLGHPVRIRTLELLSERDHTVAELLGQIDIEQSNLSQHLAVLRRSGLIDRHQDGASVRYSIRVPEVCDLLMAGRAILAKVLDGRAGLQAELRGETRSSV
jgi:ArsR family transcriptional regulator